MNSNKNPYQQQIDQLKEKVNENKQLLDDSELGLLAKDEIKELENQISSLEQASTQLADSMNKTETASSDVSKAKAIIEIRGGAGGDEAKIWAQELMRMYVRFLENNKFNIEHLDDLVFKVSGRITLQIPEKISKSDSTPSDDNEVERIIYPYQLLKFESGVHRVQRVPVTESQGRIHTSTASVAVLPEVNPQAVVIREEDLDWQFIRASGAGGQSVNKTSSAVRLTHKPTGIMVVARQERKQFQNREIALALLRSQLWEIEEEKKMQKIGEARSAIGRNMRAEKIRTYNFPQNRVTDHRINKSWYNLENIMDGELTDVLKAMIVYSISTEHSSA